MTYSIDREALLATLGLLHFLQLPSMSFLARGPLQLKRDLQSLTPINRRIVILFIGAVAFLLLGLGGLLSWRARAFTTSEVGHSLCKLLAAFWTARASAQLWMFSVWPGGRSGRVWYWGLFSLYLILAVGYWLVVWTGALTVPR